jgi:fluoride ion exporter CrcB/FEX
MSTTTTGSIRERTRQNTVRLAIWTGAWVVTLAIAVFGPIFVWDSKAISLATILVNIGVGIGMIMANKQHLDGLDELQRKIQLEAMAVALGVGLVGGLAYSTMDITNVIPFDAEISNLVMLISFAYLGAIFAGRRKYQ